MASRALRVLLLVLAAAPGSAGAAPPTVIVLSWDGVRHDYLERAPLPALERVMRDGARAERMIPVFPPTPSRTTSRSPPEPIRTATASWTTTSWSR